VALLHTNTHDAKNSFSLPSLTSDGKIIAMPKRSSKPRDINILASTIVGQTTGDISKLMPVDDGKNPAAVALGRLGGMKGGPARKAALSKKRRVAIAKKAAAARWPKKKRRSK
jgi:hypothetical protein